MKFKKIRGKKIPIRIPVPRPNRMHSTEKGARGSRSDSRCMERQAKEGVAMTNLFPCAIGSCGFSATAEKMWNLDRRVTSGKLVVLCGKDAYAARERGFRVFRLEETLRRDAERRAERDQFFERFGNARLSDAFKASGNGHGAASGAHV